MSEKESSKELQGKKVEGKTLDEWILSDFRAEIEFMAVMLIRAGALEW